jgi:hypothetical protein
MDKPPPNANPGSSQKTPGARSLRSRSVFGAEIADRRDASVATAMLLMLLMEGKPLAGPATVPAEMAE